MNIGKLTLCIAIGICTAGMICNEKPVDPPPPEEQPVIGTWELAIPPITNVTKATLNIIFAINNDSRYTLELNEQSEKVLYSSEGTWNSNDDSIYLLSSKCLVLDTMPDPDTLKTLSDSLCAIPIPLELPESDQDWDIKTEDLTIMLSGFPVPKEALNLLPLVLPILPMEKRLSE